MIPKERIILALDCGPSEACDRVERYRERAHAFKVGLQLFNAAGPRIFDLLRSCGAERIFYDAKLHDIPTTVERAAHAAAHHGLWMMNVHARGGVQMMSAAIRGARAGAAEAQCQVPLMIAVTKLTSDPIGWHQTTAHDLAMRAVDAGMDGVVCPVPTAPAIRSNTPRGFVIVTPGIRLEGESQDDHGRVATPDWALQCGVDYLVIGRSATSILRCDRD